MKYIKSYKIFEQLELSKELKELTLDYKRKSNELEIYKKEKTKSLIDKYKSKIDDCILYVSDDFDVKFITFSIEEYYVYNIDINKDDNIKLLIDSLNRTTDKLDELGAQSFIKCSDIVRDNGRILTVSNPITFKLDSVEKLETYFSTNILKNDMRIVFSVY